jgi:Gas vesicle synthesis protein GvpL/GvpF
VIHVYAFADGLATLPPLTGVDGARLEQLSVDGVTTVFSRRGAEAGGTVPREDVLRHGAVVDALLALAPAVVPVRFGEVVRDDVELGRSVGERAEGLRRRFDHVRGCVEVGVRAWSGRSQVASAATGAEYMQRRRALEAERRATIDELDGMLRALARETRVDGAPRQGRELFVAAYLVQRSALDDVRSAVDGFAADHPELTIVCTGPWAPFSFATEAGA